MASIFLSYAREDAARAQRIAQALEAAGHSVWWDRQLHAGERFSAEINRALGKAELVVVLWSRASVDSAWVQDEAAVGRDSRRLIPVLIDPVEPPLGFRQYHAVDLSRRRGSRAVEPLLAAIVEKPQQAPGGGLVSRPLSKARSRRLLGATVAGALLAAAAAIFWVEPFKGAPSNTVHLAAANPQDAGSRAMAHGLAIDLASYRAGPLAGVEIRPPGARRKSGDYRADVSLTRSGREPELTISLTSPRDRLLWSSSLRATRIDSDLRLQADAQLGAVLSCAFDPKVTAHGLKDETLAIYLDGCARMAASTGEDSGAIEAFRKVQAREPRFAPAWAKFALLEFQALLAAPGYEKEDHVMRAARAMDQAKAIDPSLPELFIVDAYLRRIDRNFAPVALGVIELGLRQNPDSAALHAARAQVLTGLGRLDEALSSATRAVTLDPLSPNLLRDHVLTLAYTGRFKQAEQRIAEAEKRWPGASAVKGMRYSYYLRYGDPRQGLRELEMGEGVSRDQIASQGDMRWYKYLQARAQPTRANIDRALADFRTQYVRDRGGALAYIMALGTFGRVNEAYKVMLKPANFQDQMLNSDIFFRPFMRSIRADRRFLQLANAIGLLPYWKRTMQWPDFCRDPQLPYDCRKEAEKIPDPVK